MHSACGTTAAANMSGIGDSIAHGDEKSAVKNTAPDSRTTRSTSDKTSTSVLSYASARSSRRNGQGFQSVSQHVKQIQRLGQDVKSRSHWPSGSADARLHSHRLLSK